MNEQFSKLVDNLVNENVRLKEELEGQHQYIIQEKIFTAKDQDLSTDADTSAESTVDRNGQPIVPTTTNDITTSEDNPIYSLPKALDLAPLDEVPFQIPDEELLSLTVDDSYSVTPMVGSLPTGQTTLEGLINRASSPK